MSRRWPGRTIAIGPKNVDAGLEALRPSSDRTPDEHLTPELEEAWDRIRLEAEEERTLEARSRPRPRRRVARGDDSGAPTPPSEAASPPEATQEATVPGVHPPVAAAREEEPPGIDGLVDLLRAVLGRSESANSAIRQRRAQYGSGRTESGKGPFGRYAHVVGNAVKEHRRRARAWAEEALLWTAFRVATTPHDLRSEIDRAWYHDLKTIRPHLFPTLTAGWVDARAGEILAYHAASNHLDIQEAARRIECRADWAAVSHLAKHDFEAVIAAYELSLEAIGRLLTETLAEAGLAAEAVTADPAIVKLRSRQANAGRRLRDAKAMPARHSMWRRHYGRLNHQEAKEKTAPHAQAPMDAAVSADVVAGAPAQDPTEEIRTPEPEIASPEAVPESHEHDDAVADQPPSEASGAADGIRERKAEQERERLKRENGPGFHGMMRLVREILDGTTMTERAVVERRSEYAFSPPAPWGIEAVVDEDLEEQKRRRTIAIAEEALIATLGRVHATTPSRRTKEEDWWLLEIEDAQRDKRRRLLEAWIDDHCRAIEGGAQDDLAEASAAILARHAQAALAQAAIAEAFAAVGAREKALVRIRETYRATLLEAGIDASKAHSASVEASQFEPLLAQLHEAEGALRDAEYALADARAKRDGTAPEPKREKSPERSKGLSKAARDRLRYEDGGPGMAALVTLAERILASDLDAAGAIELRRESVAVGVTLAWGIEASIPDDPQLERDRRAHALAEEAVLRQIERIRSTPDSATEDEKRWLAEVENEAFRKRAMSGWIERRRSSILNQTRSDGDLQAVAARVEQRILETSRYQSGVQTALMAYVRAKKEVGEAGNALEAATIRMRIMNPGDRRYPDVVREQTQAKRHLEALTDRLVERQRDLARARNGSPGGAMVAKGPEPSPGTSPGRSETTSESAGNAGSQTRATYQSPMKRSITALLGNLGNSESSGPPAAAPPTGEPLQTLPKGSASPPEPKPDGNYGRKRPEERADNIVFLPAFPARDRRNEPHPLTNEKERRAAIEAEDRARADAAESRRKAVVDARLQAQRKGERDRRRLAASEKEEGPSARSAAQPAPLQRSALPASPPKWATPRIEETWTAAVVRVTAEQKQAMTGIGKPRRRGRPPADAPPAPKWNDVVTLRGQVDALEKAGGRIVGQFRAATWSEIVALAMWADSVLIVSAPSFTAPAVLPVRRPRSALVADWHRTVSTAFNALSLERRIDVGPIFGRVSILEPTITVDEVLACFGRLGLRVRLGRPGPNAAANMKVDDE